MDRMSPHHRVSDSPLPCLPSPHSRNSSAQALPVQFQIWGLPRALASLHPACSLYLSLPSPRSAAQGPRGQPSCLPCLPMPQHPFATVTPLLTLAPHSARGFSLGSILPLQPGGQSSSVYPGGCSLALPANHPPEQRRSSPPDPSVGSRSQLPPSMSTRSGTTSLSSPSSLTQPSHVCSHICIQIHIHTSQSRSASVSKCHTLQGILLLKPYFRPEQGGGR